MRHTKHTPNGTCKQKPNAAPQNRNGWHVFIGPDDEKFEKLARAILGDVTVTVWPLKKRGRRRAKTVSD